MQINRLFKFYRFNYNREMFNRCSSTESRDHLLSIFITESRDHTLSIFILYLYYRKRKIFHLHTPTLLIFPVVKVGVTIVLILFQSSPSTTVIIFSKIFSPTEKS